MASTTTRTYETVYILSPTVSEDDAATIHGKIDSVIKKFKGEVMVRDDWGSRNLAYTINDFTSGRYSIINYTGDPGVVSEIERHFRILSDVIRYSTVRLEPDYDYKLVKKQITNSEEEAKKAREQRRRY